MYFDRIKTVIIRKLESFCQFESYNHSVVMRAIKRIRDKAIKTLVDE